MKKNVPRRRLDQPEHEKEDKVIDMRTHHVLRVNAKQEGPSYPCWGELRRPERTTESQSQSTVIYVILLYFFTDKQNGETSLSNTVHLLQEKTTE